ncbi:MAG: hypothetical protein JW741_21765 [Sedimentisphaerales bacterium]|nr:hypothetical protein [Sedimentisphaerales bacterium]
MGYGKPILCGVAAMLLLLSGWARPADDETQVIRLSGRGKDDPVPWEFFCTAGRNSGQWTTIGVPSNWELRGFGNYNYGRDREKSDEQGKYRRTFAVPPDWADRRVFLVFDGVMTDAEVWVNGKSAGPIHQGGFYRFRYEIGDLIRPGENLLEVTVSKVSANRSVEEAERHADYWVFGGIYRPVRLEAVPRQFIDWVAIDARADGHFWMDVYINGPSDADAIRAQITGPVNVPTQQPREHVFEWSPSTEGTDGSFEIPMGLGRSSETAVLPLSADPFEVRLDASRTKAAVTGNVAGHKTWTAETPYLYAVKVDLLRKGQIVHTMTKRFGFRTFEVRPGDGLYLNGQKIVLKGVCRHSFWPDSGRCLSRQISYDDVKLIKEMNMNAVRMSHYPPDEHFLDACDELGLYVLDELAGWQKPPYDTEIGKKLVKEMVTRDVCHPSILFWDNGNEGGWNRELDSEFALYDPQKRTVLHPWENFNDIDTDHYETYASTQNKLSGSTLFMPTEFLHGLYDGGHGAGLDDYWNATLASPMGAGGFLWALVDEGVVRTDKDGQIDVAGNQAPDGIVGPYRQKEASFYTIRQIWTPVQIDMEKLPEGFDGTIDVENRYDFTNLQDCAFDVQLASFPGPSEKKDGHTIFFRHTFPGPNVRPHQRGTLSLGLPDNWRDAEALYLTASDPNGRPIRTWSWGIKGLDHYCEKRTQWVESGDLRFTFLPGTGQLADLKMAGKPVAFTGPWPIGGVISSPTISWHDRKSTSTLTGATDPNRNPYIIDVNYPLGNMKYTHWMVYPGGWMRLDYEFALEGQFDVFGINFDFPEEQMRSMRFLGDGPYRVWKNRLKGGTLDVWSNKYKNDVPGVTWDYPEFKGYYKNWRWVVFETAQGDITIVNGTDDLYLGVYTPNDGPNPANTKLDLPATGIALLHGIPAIGTKFNKPEALGPQGRKNTASGTYRGTVWLHFGE